MKKTIILSTVLGTALFYSLALAHGAHEHGVAKMNIAIEGATVEIALESPLINAISFEHAPNTEAQRAEVRAMAAKLRQPEEIFLLTKAAQCRPVEVSLTSENLPPELLGETAAATESDKKAPAAKDDDKAVAEAHHEHDEHDGHDAHDGHDGHGDLDASFTFACAKPEALKSLDVQLFKAWPSLHEVEVQLVTPSGQKGAELTSKKPTLTW